MAEPARTHSSLLEQIQSLLDTRILVLDGAYGSLLQELKLGEDDYRGSVFPDHELPLAGNHDVLCLTQPEIVADAHRRYLQAGADIIKTNSFSATAIAQADYGLADKAAAINFAAATIARAEADAIATGEWPRFVAGILGPTNKTASLSPDVNDPGFRAITYEELTNNYLDAARALVAGGADLILIETVFDTLNAKAAVYALHLLETELGYRPPLMISGTITDASGRTLSGQTCEAFWQSLSHARPLSIGLNCALGAEQLRPYVDALNRIAPTYVSVHPNAGLPNAFGEYDETPEIMSQAVGEFAQSGLVNLIGGCCGTTPEHIAAMRQAVAGCAPRPLPTLEPKLNLSGLEPLSVDAASLFLNVGERTNVTGSGGVAPRIPPGD